MSTKSPKVYKYNNKVTADDLAIGLGGFTLSAYKEAENQAGNPSGRFTIAISGGSLPKIFGEALQYIKYHVDFNLWDVFFADERAVPLDHEDSNYKLVKEEFDKIGFPVGKLHPIDISLLHDTQGLAEEYEEQLVQVFASKGPVNFPKFDLILLGMGPDGHTCSLFPGHELLKEKEAWVCPVEDSPKPPPRRITLSLPVITHAKKIAFVATGAGKAEMLMKIFTMDEGLPCQLVNDEAIRLNREVVWFIDKAAGEKLKNTNFLTQANEK